MDFDTLFPLLVGIACAWLLWKQLHPRVLARRMLGRQIPEPSPAEGSGVRLYYFWSPHCGMCRGMTPLIDRLRETRSDLIKVNLAESRELAGSFGIAATPTLVLVRDGVVEKVLLGAQSETRILELLDR
jgi:thioredoxin 1